MSLFTFVRQFVRRFQRRTTQTHGGAHSASTLEPTLSTTSDPELWFGGQALQNRTDTVESPTRTHAREDTVRIAGSSREEWIEGSATEVQR